MQADEPERATGFTCNLCNASFGRLEHLQRHTISSHSVEKPFPCTSCSQSFARRDVLVRHLKSCKAKAGAGGSEIVPPRKRGRKRRSCDVCARLKRACSGTQPCLSCVHRRQSCSFPGSSKQDNKPFKVGQPEEVEESSSGEDWETSMLPQEDSVPPTLSHTSSTDEAAYQESRTIGSDAGPTAPPQQFIQPATISQDQPSDLFQSYDQLFDVPTQAVSPLRFLANFTNTKGMADSFDCGTVEERTNVVQTILLQLPAREARLDDGRLLATTHFIVSGLKEAIESQRRRNSAGFSWSYTLELACFGFFAMDNLQRLLISYWAFWHPNCPIVHKPTFRAKTSSPTLVAVMALIGACLSPAAGDREAALMWLDVVEEWVFAPTSFSDDPLPCDPQDITNPGLQNRLHALQAAYCCILLQTWEGTDVAKRRARRSRYTDIIGAFRSVCSKAVTHDNLLSYLDHPDPDSSWKRFAMKEELIRTLTYIVLLDAAYVIFNNTPPRMALQEARIVLASPEACFQAEDPHTWEGAMRIWASSESGAQQLTIEQVVRLLYKPRFLEHDWARLLQMSSLNLFTLIHPLHVQLFHVRCHPLPECQTQLQRQALDNWKLLHAQRTGVDGLPELVPLHANDWWKRTGFPQYALEYWGLADLILTSCEPLPGFDQNTNVNGSWASQLLSSYDESDMSQVHDLVTMFSGMNL